MKQQMFEVGSMVRVLDNSYGGFEVGDTAEVVENDQPRRMLVRFTNGNHKDFNWYFSPDGTDGRVELVTSKLDQQTDIDLHRGYTEECSGYRACRNEEGNWVIEASRVKIIAQCSDEAEARRIEQALNSSRSEAI